MYLQGIGVSPGIAIAPALCFSRGTCDIPKYAITDIRGELSRLDAAIEHTRRDLLAIYEKTVEAVGKAHAEIFRAHLMILDDVALRDDLALHLEKEGMNVEHVLDSIAKRYVQAMGNIDDLRFRERTTDLLDVVDRLLRYLLEAERPNLRHIERSSIIVAHDLSPSDTASLDLDKALGLVVEAGSVTSHSAILARALEIPAIVGVPAAAEGLSSGTEIIIDGSSGVMIANPSRETVQKYIREQQRLKTMQDHLLQTAKQGPARTLDGVAVDLQANIELPLEIQHSLKVNAQGIGLYRTEYLFLNRDTLPSEEEQYQAYSHVAAALAPATVTLRTMDIGGDKFVAHLQVLKEDNPQLGFRAVRFCLARPDIFKVQLRAMLRASARGNVRIMFPMISGIEELRKVKAVLDEVRLELEEQHVEYDRDLKIGSMIEVPSAVTLADLLATECDFFSLGTNDLIQYLLAVDRVNEKIAHLYEPAHPAVVRMIHKTAVAALERHIPCCICGEMAGDPLYTELLLGLGVSAFSMAPVSIPALRAEIASIEMDDARALAAEVLQMRTSSEIKALIRRRHQDRAVFSDALS